MVKINPIIKLKNAEKIFPAVYTKMRSEDFITKAVANKKNLTKKEYEALLKVPETIRNRHYTGGFEFIAERKKNKINFIDLDD